MRSLSRPTPSAGLQLYLANCTARVVSQTTKADQTAEARAHWKSAKKTKHFDQIRQLLTGMASGRVRCMYCEDSQGTDIDHFQPIDRAPERAFEWDNYLLACSHCNSNLKREKFPVDDHGNALLIDPCIDDPAQHLQLMIQSSHFGALSRKGLESMEVFGLNTRQILVDGRRTALVTALALIPVYAKLRKENTPATNLAADLIFESLGTASFSIVLVTFIEMFKNRSPALEDNLVDAFTMQPELLTLT